MTCPTPDQLDRWVNEQLDPAGQAALAAHIDGCARCQAALDQLTTDPPSVKADADPELDRLLEQLKETLPGRAPTTADADRPVVPGYDLIEVIGRGGMGVVFRARQRGVNREVAVKLLHRGAADTEDAARFRREGEALGKLRHPHVVQVFDVGVADGRPFLVMEYVPGGPLSKFADGKPLSAETAAALVEPVARAVQHAHDHGVLHRDLKPGNILLAGGEVVRWSGGSVVQSDPTTQPLNHPATPKVADFGLARNIDPGESLTLTGVILGTPSYMAPEQVSGDERLTPACDVYGLGAVLYELLTGRPPFSGASPADVLVQVRNQDPVPPSRVIPTLPRDLNTICLKCLEKDPKKRYPSAAAVAEDLRRWQAGEPILARPAGMAEKAWKWARRRRGAAAAVGLALFLLVVGLPTATVLWLSTERTRREADANYERADRTLYAAHIAQAELHYRLNDLRRTRYHLDQCERQPDRRGWEWYYLHGLAYSEHVDLPAPPPPDERARTLYAVAFARDGRRLVAGGGVRNYLTNAGWEPGDLAAWDLGDPAAGPTPLGPEPLAVTAAAFGAAGRLFTVGADVWYRKVPLKAPGHPTDPRPGPAAVLRARDGRTGAVLFERPFHPPYLDRGPVAPTRPALAISPDGTRVAVGTADGLAVFDGRTGDAVFDRPRAVDARFDPAAGTLWVFELGWGFTGTITRLVALDPATGRELARRPVGEPDGWVWDFGPSARLFARVTPTGDVVLTPTGPGPETRVRTGLPRNQVTALAVSPDDRLLAVGGTDGTVRVWEVATGRARQVFRGHPNRVTAVAFDPAGQRVASVGWDRAVKVWDLGRTPEFTEVGAVEGSAARAEDFAFVDGGRHLLIARAPGGALEKWDTVTGADTRLGTLDMTDDKLRVAFPGRTAAFAGDGRRVAAVSGADPRRVQVWDTDPFGPPVRLGGCSAAVRFLAVSAAGDRVAALAFDRRGPGPFEVVVWQVGRPEPLLTVRLDGEACPALALSADGRRVAAAAWPPGGDQAPCRLQVWDVDGGREVAAQDAGGTVTALAFDGPGGRLAAAAAADAGPDEAWVRVWDTGSWAEVRSIRCLEAYSHLAFAPDGRRLAGGTNELLTLWDPAAGNEEVLTLRGRPRAGSELPFNPRVVFDSTGTKLAAAQNDFSVYVWTAAGYGRR